MWTEFGRWSLAWHKQHHKPLFNGHSFTLLDPKDTWKPICPRPEGWSLPSRALSQPTKVVLNPLLEHTRHGWPPMVSFINLPWLRLMYAGARHAYEGMVPVPDADLAQGATFPLVDRLIISAIADDVSPQLTWPILVCNPVGVNVGDVIVAIYETFQQHMTREEYEILSPRRQDQLQRAYWARVNEPLNGGDICPSLNDGLRRIDYFGDNILFRGLEPSRNKKGNWIMFLGPP